MKVAFVTYNSVGRNLSSGWHGTPDRRALVLQNTKGEAWAVNPDNPLRSADGDYGPSRARRTEEIDRLWGQLQEHLPELDHLVVYVGTGGSDRAVELASQLPASKVTFVGCDCNMGHKVQLLRRYGFSNDQTVMSECGGIQTMGELFESFMVSGTVPALQLA